MKIAITGHTTGLGKAIYDHMISKNHTVIGMSRSNGFTLPSEMNQVIAIAKECDYFFNNVHYDIVQAKLLERTFRFTKVITSGSIAADSGNLVNDPFCVAKLQIENVHRRLKKWYGHGRPMLLLKMGYLENLPKNNTIPYTQIINGIEYWMNNPRVSMLEFENEIQSSAS